MCLSLVKVAWEIAQTFLDAKEGKPLQAVIIYDVIVTSPFNMKALKCKTLGACMAWQMIVSQARNDFTIAVSPDPLLM